MMLSTGYSFAASDIWNVCTRKQMHAALKSAIVVNIADAHLQHLNIPALQADVVHVQHDKLSKATTLMLPHVMTKPLGTGHRQQQKVASSSMRHQFSL